MIRFIKNYNMNKWTILFLLGVSVLQCGGMKPFKPKHGSLPYLVYIPSRYRGLCVGTLVSRTAVLTAAVCVTNPLSMIADTRSINVVTGASYRHPRRGIRVQVVKILIPKLATGPQQSKSFMMEKSPAVLLLKRKVADALTEIPLRAITVDYTGQKVLTLQEECLIAGWHFHFTDDKIYPVRKFLLQNNVRAQFMTIVKKNTWCDALGIKFQKTMSSLGFSGYFDNAASLCVRDSDRAAQPCHGMYGAPLVCAGRTVGMLMAPDAQWDNCTGYSNLIHVFSSGFLRKFMTCVSGLFEPDLKVDWTAMREAVYDDTDNSYDYIPTMYDKMDVSDSASTESEETD